MKKKYLDGYYFIKIKGRGLVRTWLTKSQAKALTDLCFQGGLMDLEKVDFDVNPNND